MWHWFFFSVIVWDQTWKATKNFAHKKEKKETEQGKKFHRYYVGTHKIYIVIVFFFGLKNQNWTEMMPKQGKLSVQYERKAVFGL